MGSIFDKSNTNEDPDSRIGWMAGLPSWLFPEKLIILGYTVRFLTDFIQYGKSEAFREIPLATKFYQGHSLTVIPKVRGMGLGKELILRSMKMAQDLQCSHIYILATSLYSQAIFRKLQYQVVNQVAYDDFKDKNGKIFFKDMKEHKNCQIVTYDMKNFSQ